MKIPVKIQVLKDTSNNMYAVYRYNLWHRLFGEQFQSVLAYGYTKEEAIEGAKRKLFGTTIRVELTELRP